MKTVSDIHCLQLTHPSGFGKCFGHLQCHVRLGKGMIAALIKIPKKRKKTPWFHGITCLSLGGPGFLSFNSLIWFKKSWRGKNQLNKVSTGSVVSNVPLNPALLLYIPAASLASTAITHSSHSVSGGILADAEE